MNRQIRPEQLALDPDQDVKPAAQKAPTTQSAEPDDFDWNNPDEVSIILHEQRATAAYRNRAGELIIRQRAAFDEDRDAFLYVAPEYEVEFLEALAAVHRGDR